MNTTKNLDKIFSKLPVEVNLSTQKVELNAIDDLKKKLDKNMLNFDNSVNKVRSMADDFVDLEGDFGKISNEASLIRKQLSDLGIDDPKDLGYVSLKAKELEKLSREFINNLR
jgi:hypothetical protein|tara:strand:- start:78 stop:416 length:339 start_codon:yes stop_codon:yes gene_type:complete